MSSLLRLCLVLGASLDGLVACSASPRDVGPASDGALPTGVYTPESGQSTDGEGAAPDSAVPPPPMDATTDTTANAIADAMAPDETSIPAADASGIVADAADGTGMDQPPDRGLMVDLSAPQLYAISFKPSDADPQAVTPDDVQKAEVDTTKHLQAKLAVVLSGTNNPPGPVEVGDFAAALGFHVYVIAYHNSYDASTQSNADFFGNSRFNELDGKGRTPGVVVAAPDSVEVRVTKALLYLQAKNPAGDWAYYLGKDGSVRWSDVVFIGHSHGATSAAAYAKKLRVWRAISLSGPRDTNPVVASWLTLPSATPIERFYGFTGTTDAQHPDHIKSMEVMGYLGALTNVATVASPFNESHRLEYNGGHGDSANCANFAAVCKYMLGVP